MERFEALAESLEYVARFLAEDRGEPGVPLSEWADLTVRVALVRQRMGAALASVEEEEDEEDEETRALVCQRTAALAGYTAELLLATGDPVGGRSILERALPIARTPKLRAKLKARLRDLDAPVRRVRSAPREPGLQARLDARTRARADGLVREWPLRALALYTQVPGEAGRDAARAIIDSFGEAPSLWMEAEESVEAWLEREDVRASSEAPHYQARLTQARATHLKVETFLKSAKSSDAKTLVEAFHASPANQALAVAVARQKRSRENRSEVMAELQALGPVGRLTGAVRVLLADCHRARGELKEADALLSSFVFEKLKFLINARREYHQQAAEVSQKWDFGEFECERTRRQPPFLYQLWPIPEVHGDPRVKKANAKWNRYGDVSWATLELGLMKLRRSREEPEETRTALLEEAERLLLSIRIETNQEPYYTLALGEVYHRLGRSALGEEILGLVEEFGDSDDKWLLAEMYTRLGMLEKARALAPDEE